MGNVFFKEKLYEESIASYTKSIQLDPKNYVVYSNRSLAYFKLGDMENAIKDAQQAISINQEYPKSYYNLGISLQEMKMYSEALSAFQQVSKLSPSREINQKIAFVEFLMIEDGLNTFSTPLEEKYVASMILAALGDAMGYKNGDWEFTYNGASIHKEMKETFGGISGISCCAPDWIVSDDTVMLLATSEALILPNLTTTDDIMTQMAQEYIKCWDDMNLRGPGPTCEKGIEQLQRVKWNQVRYDKRGGGNGASMRSSTIGLRYPGPNNREKLIAISLESGRLTHTHPTGFLGAVCAASFTAFALEGIPPKKWGFLLMTEILPLCKEYCKIVGRDWDEIQKDWSAFEKKFSNYLSSRGITDGESDPVFPSEYGVKEREDFYKKWSFSGWAGASGDDSCIISYDALLGSGDNWEEFCLRGVLHGGDNDSTGAIGGAWFGALYGFKTVFPQNYRQIEKRMRITELARSIHQLTTNEQ